MSEPIFVATSSDCGDTTVEKVFTVRKTAENYREVMRQASTPVNIEEVEVVEGDVEYVLVYLYQLTHVDGNDAIIRLARNSGYRVQRSDEPLPEDVYWEERIDALPTRTLGSGNFYGFTKEHALESAQKFASERGLSAQKFAREGGLEVS